MKTSRYFIKQPLPSFIFITPYYLIANRVLDNRKIFVLLSFYIDRYSFLVLLFSSHSSTLLGLNSLYISFPVGFLNLDNRIRYVLRINFVCLTTLLALCTTKVIPSFCRFHFYVGHWIWLRLLYRNTYRKKLLVFPTVTS